ncbi:hypothetical protein D3C73_1580510 [compost metagenome]
MLSCPRRFNGGIERQQIRLLGDFRNDPGQLPDTPEMPLQLFIQFDELREDRRSLLHFSGNLQIRILGELDFVGGVR